MASNLIPSCRKHKTKIFFLCFSCNKYFLSHSKYFSIIFCRQTKIFFLHLNIFIIFSFKVTPKGQCGDGRRLRGPSSKSRWARCSRPCLRAPRVTTCAALNLTRPAARGCSTWRSCSTKSDILGESTSISCEGIQYFHPY